MLHERALQQHGSGETPRGAIWRLSENARRLPKKCAAAAGNTERLPETQGDCPKHSGDCPNMRASPCVVTEA
jgi:hypothetical protein